MFGAASQDLMPRWVLAVEIIATATAPTAGEPRHSETVLEPDHARP